MAAPRITIFTTMKPFRGEFVRIQRNAIRSWLALEPTPEVLVFGNDEGVAEVCKEFGLRHIPDVRTAPSGAPYVDDLFAKAQRMASNDILCYVNADIILLSNFIWALDTVYSRLGLAIVVCTPVNIQLALEIDTADPTWEARIQKEVSQELPAPIGADIFLFPRRFSWNLSEMVVGRCIWDNAILWRACTARIPAVDVSAALVAIHQDHPFTTHPGLSRAICAEDSRLQEEFQANLRAVPWWQRQTWRIDIPYELTDDGHIARRYRFPRWHLVAAVACRQMSSLKVWALERTFRLRRSLGLYRWWRKDRCVQETFPKDRTKITRK